MGGLGGDARADQAEAARDAVDVGVDRQGRAVEVEHQDAGGRLGADAGEGAQPGAGLVERQVGQEAEVEAAALLDDPGEDLLDAPGLEAGEAAAADGVGHLLVGRVEDRLPGGEALAQAAMGAVAVHVGGVLGEDRADQAVERVAGGLVPPRAVDLVEEGRHPRDLARAVAARLVLPRLGARRHLPLPPVLYCRRRAA